MGGYGSGRTGGWPTVEDCRSLVLSADHVTRLVREAMREIQMQTIPDGRLLNIPWQKFRWTRSGESEPWAEVEIRLELRTYGGTARLRYDVDHISRATGPQHYAVLMVTTPCRFGGLRWWWLCPATHRRVGKLYLPNGGCRFLSRGWNAYRLAYASQREGITDRMHARSRKLYAKLGADYLEDSGGSWPSKPRGMHRRTYDVICDRLNTEAEGLNMGLQHTVERLTRRR